MNNATPRPPLTPLNAPLTRLFERLLRDMDHRESPEWDAQDSRLDPAVYCDPAILEREKSQIFRRLPLCLGHADQLREPGSVLARDLLGLPLLLTPLLLPLPSKTALGIRRRMMRKRRGLTTTLLLRRREKQKKSQRTAAWK